LLAAGESGVGLGPLGNLLSRQSHLNFPSQIRFSLIEYFIKKFWKRVQSSESRKVLKDSQELKPLNFETDSSSLLLTNGMSLIILILEQYDPEL